MLRAALSHALSPIARELSEQLGLDGEATPESSSSSSSSSGSSTSSSPLKVQIQRLSQRGALAPGAPLMRNVLQARVVCSVLLLFSLTPVQWLTAWSSQRAA